MDQGCKRKTQTLSAQDTRWVATWDLAGQTPVVGGERKTARELRRELKGSHKVLENLNDELISTPTKWKTKSEKGPQWENGDRATWQHDAEPTEAFRVRQMEGPRQEWLCTDMHEIEEPGATTSRLNQESTTQVSIKQSMARNVRVIETEDFTIYCPTTALEDLEIDPLEWA
ncbi:hypothetical protein CBR_g6411 [Chara braunii]|uniref:Uncharacterized protein n=1 Tax=Chara braunii TaxID=69332 RepID=A0A388KJQ5_CHABU|nr:hypothetical protein CBR_g6411 [Chara braunii]|eukprot:GBG70284.1 hypothetical protein CBR_g6411 [Chara braunii]